MAEILVIDDDPGMLTLVEIALKNRGFKVRTAESGKGGLVELQKNLPDAMIIDKMMPGMDGTEVVRRIRLDPRFSHLPILVLTAETKIEGKVDAFEAGADDYLNKPFSTEELVARMTALLRRSRPPGHDPNKYMHRDPHIIAVHSLRGGVGCTTMAVNLAIALRNIWRAPTLLLDTVFLAGHVSLFLDKPFERTWAELSNYDSADIDEDLLETLLHRYDNGMEFISAPAAPSDAELVTTNNVERSVDILKTRYEYIVLDLPHDFSDLTLALLDRADVLVVMVAPELAAVRAGSLALETYDKLGYDLTTIELVVNRLFDDDTLALMDITKALGKPISAEIPYAGRRCVRAINTGRPIVEAWPEHGTSREIEKLAFKLSKQAHREIPPISPTEAWVRISEYANGASSNLMRRTVKRFLGSE